MPTAYSDRTLRPILPRNLSPLTASPLPAAASTLKATCEIGLPPSLPFRLALPLRHGIKDRPKLWDQPRLRVPRRGLPSFDEFIAGSPALPDENPNVYAARTPWQGDSEMAEAPTPYHGMSPVSVPIAADLDELPHATASRLEPWHTSTAAPEAPEAVMLQGHAEEVLRGSVYDQDDTVLFDNRRYPVH